MYCGICGAEISDTDEYCGKCGARQKIQPTPSMPSRSRTKLIAAVVILILILAGLFGSGLIKQMPSTSFPSLTSQSTGTSTVSSSSVTTSRVSAETSNIASTAEASSSTSNLPSEPPSVFSSSKPAPTAVGCYHYNQGEWENVTCLPSEEVLKWGNLPGPFLGIQSHSSPSSPITPSTRLTYGIVMVNIRYFGAEADTHTDPKDPYYGAHSDWYSIQLNTNTFTGNNGHTDWVQFTYQKYARSTLCIWQIDLDVPNDQGYYNNCVSAPDVSLDEVHPWESASGMGWESFIEGYVATGSLGQGSTPIIGIYAWLNGDGGLYYMAAPDMFGLATANVGWVEASGGIMGSGNSAIANFYGSGLQTDIGVDSCPNGGHLSLWQDCGGQQISGGMTPQPGSQVTGESNSLTQYAESLTSYYQDTHWWLSSVSGVNYASQPMVQFVNYQAAFGLAAVTLFTMEVQPSTGTVNAGYDTSTTVNVISVNAVQTEPITMRVDGWMTFLGTEDLSGMTCTFGLPFQPGSKCSYTMNMHTSPTASPGSYDIRITASGPQEDHSAMYNLIINITPSPMPVIVSPAQSGSLNEGANTLIGYAHGTDSGELWVPCSRLQFQVTFSDGTSLQATPTEDSTYQQTGFCDWAVDLTVEGPATVMLSATNLAGVKGSATADFSIVSEQQTSKFTFTLSVTPPTLIITVGGQESYGVVLTATGGVPQPVYVTVSGLPDGATYTLSTSPATPTTIVTLTINVSSNTPLGSYEITITGSGGGSTASQTVQLNIVNLG